MNSHVKKIFFLIILFIGSFGVNISHAHQCTTINNTPKTDFNYASFVIENSDIDLSFKEQSPFNNNENNNVTYSELEDEDDNNDDNQTEKTLKDNKYLSAQNYFSSFIYDHFLRHIYCGTETASHHHNPIPITDQNIYILFSVIRI